MSILPIYFIGQCLSLDEHPSFRDEIIVQFTDENYDWQSFIWTCSNHLVLPVIYLKFRDHDLLEYLPDVLANHLKEVYELNHARNKQIIGQMKELTATLNMAGISPIFLKGTGNLIDGVYKDVGERIIGDIDFLVPENDYLTAAEIFQKEGYSICLPTDEPVEKMKHYPRLWKEDVTADIEIHRLPVTIKHAPLFSAELVIQFKKTVTDYPGCFVLSDNHKAIQSFIHSQLTNSGHFLGIVTLRDVYDLYCFSKRVDLKQITQVTPFRQKYIVWLKICEKLLNLPDNFYYGQTIHSRMYGFKHDLNISFPFIYSSIRLIWTVFVTIGILMHRIKKSLSNTTTRRKDISELFTSEWYRHTFEGCLKIYKGTN